jgi:hypothetical protein
LVAIFRVDENHETVIIERSLSRVEKASSVVAATCRVLLVLVAFVLVSMVALFLLQIALGHPFQYSISVKMLIYGIPTCLLAISFLKVVADIFKEIVGGVAPFNERQARRVRLLAYLLFVKVVLEAVLSVGTSMIAQVGTYNITYIDSGGVNGLSLSVDLGALFMGVLMLCLSLVFEYGSLLQKMTDETV